MSSHHVVSAYMNDLPNVRTATRPSTNVWSAPTDRLPSPLDLLKSDEKAHVYPSDTTQIPENNNSNQVTCARGPNMENFFNKDVQGGKNIANRTSTRHYASRNEAGSSAPQNQVHRSSPGLAEMDVVSPNLSPPETVSCTPNQDSHLLTKAPEMRLFNRGNGSQAPSLTTIDMIGSTPSFDLGTAARKPKGKMHETLKKALGVALSMANKTSETRFQESCSSFAAGTFGSNPSVQQDAQGSENLTSLVSPVSSNPSVQETFEEGAGATHTWKAQNRCRFFREADRIARQTERFTRTINFGQMFRSEVPRSADSTGDAQLTNSSDVAHEPAILSRDSSASHSVINSLTGKRKRDKDQISLHPDHSDASVIKIIPSTAVKESYSPETEPKRSGANVTSDVHTKIPIASPNAGQGEQTETTVNLNNSLLTKKRSISSLHVSPATSDSASRNELDFLATVVISQEEDKLRRLDAMSKNSNGSSVPTQRNPMTIPEATNEAQQSGIVNPISVEDGIASLVTHVPAPLPVGQGQGSVQDQVNMDSEVTSLAYASGHQINQMFPALHITVAGPQLEIQTSQGEESEAEPKSEISYLDNNVLSITPAGQAENSPQIGPFVHVLAESSPQAEVDEDEITPAPPAAHTRLSSTPSSARQASPSHISPVDPKRCLRQGTPARNVEEDCSEITPAPRNPARSGLQMPRSQVPQAGGNQERIETLKSHTGVQAVILEDEEHVTCPKRTTLTRSVPASQKASASPSAGVSIDPGSAQDGQGNSQAAENRTKFPYEFCCEFCGALFNRRFNLNKHMRSVHQNIRKFKCSVCDERFLQKSHRAAHLLAVHQKLRPFVCHICAKSFSWLGVLRKHLQAIHKVTVPSTSKRAKRPAADGNRPPGDGNPPAGAGGVSST